MLTNHVPQIARLSALPKTPVVHNLLEDPTVLEVAERRGKTPAQVINQHK